MHSGTWRSVALCFTAAVWLLATGPAAAQCPAWSPPTTMEPLNAGTQSFAIFHNRLIITGGFTSIGGVATGGPVAFDGSTFTPMTLGRASGGSGLRILNWTGEVDRCSTDQTGEHVCRA